jgi:hypothetical protein
VGSFLDSLYKNVPLLSQPEGQELPCGFLFGLAVQESSNPLPARRPGATAILKGYYNPGCLFQSSPSPKARSYSWLQASCP